MIYKHCTTPTVLYTLGFYCRGHKHPKNDIICLNTWGQNYYLQRFNSSNLNPCFRCSSRLSFKSIFYKREKERERDMVFTKAEAPQPRKSPIKRSEHDICWYAQILVNCKKIS